MNGFLILMHAAEITVWALFYLWAGCLPDAESAFYFSGITYTTVGYGDLTLLRLRYLAVYPRASRHAVIARR